MAYVSDGSRVCDGSRVALAAIDADYTMTNILTQLIYCMAIDGAAGDRMRIAGVGQGEFTMHWRRTGGTFAAITDETEVRISQFGTVLTGAAVTTTTARCNETATFISGGGVEVDGGASTFRTLAAELRDENSTEWQVGLDFTNALVGQQYEFRAVILHDAGTTNIDYAAAITTPGAVATIEQEGFRFRNDDGTESGATFAAAQDTNVTLPTLTPKRVRFLLNGTLDPASAQFQIEYRKVGDAGWIKVNP